jgi:hypothetical protein
MFQPLGKRINKFNISSNNPHIFLTAYLLLKIQRKIKTKERKKIE